MATDLATKAIAEARGWIGTPYMHQASMKGVGADCLGLLRGVWRALYGDEPEMIPAYSPDWGETTGGDLLAEGIGRHLDAIALDALVAGDVAVFRVLKGGPAKHCGLIASRDGKPSLIHAWSGHRVAEVPYDRAWQRRLAYAYRLRAI